MSDALQFHVVSTCKTSQLTANHRRASEAGNKGGNWPTNFTEMDIFGEVPLKHLGNFLGQGEISVLHR